MHEEFIRKKNWVLLIQSTQKSFGLGLKLTYFHTFYAMGLSVSSINYAAANGLR